MIRALWFFLKLAIVIAALAWLADRPGRIEILWQGWRIETSVFVATVAVLLLIVAALLLYRLWRGLAHARREIVRRRVNSRRRRGYRALSRGMVAVAAGDAGEAQRYARHAESLLSDPPLTLLLAAQAAQLGGDDQAAKSYFTAMLERADMEFLGLRGLLTMALRRHDWHEALRLARRAHELQPNTPWVNDTLLDLEVRTRSWGLAETNLRAAIKSKRIDPATGRNRLASLLLEHARECEAQGDESKALDLARRAEQLQPGNPPAAVMAARLLARRGKASKALSTLEAAWALSPHPDVAAAYADLIPDESPLDRLRRIEALHRRTPGSVDGHLAVAEAALAAKVWGTARQHLGEALRLRPTARVFRLFAELERAEHGNDSAAREWLAKGADAPADPRWVCADCGYAAKEWTGLCPNCGAFDSLTWRSPEAPVRISADEVERRALTVVEAAPKPVPQAGPAPPPGPPPAGGTPPARTG